VATFSSPLLASVDRLVSRVEGLFAGPAIENRSLKFADRLLARSLPGGAGLYAPGEAAPLTTTEAAAPSGSGRAASLRAQQLASWGWVLPTPWLPSPAALRGGPIAASRPVPARASAPTGAAAPTAARPGAVLPLPAAQPVASPPSLPFISPEPRSPEAVAATAGRARPGVAPAAADAPSLPPSVSAGVPAAAAPTETRVRDWLLPLPPQAADVLPASVTPTPMARSFGHLLWSDQRLLRGPSPSESGPLPGAWASPLSVAAPPSLVAPPAGLRPAAPIAGVSLPMVRAVDLTPSLPQRPTPGAMSEAAQRRPPAARPELPLAVLPAVAERAPTVGPANSGLRPVEPLAPPSVQGAVAAVPSIGAPAAPWAAGAPEAVAAPSVSPGFAAVPALSPSLFASPVLSTSAASSSLLALFASGRAPATSAAERAPGRTAWPSVGGLATHVENFASSVGGRAAAGSAGLGNPFGGVESWRAAPGVSAVLARTFSALPVARPSAPLSLPFVSAPRAEAAPSVRPTLPAAVRAAASPALAASGPRDAGAAPVAAPRLLVVPSPAQGAALETAPAALPSLAGHAPSAAAAPWRQAGGVAALAELFAAGVGLTTAAAGGVAQQAGVALGSTLVPPWLSPSLPALLAHPGRLPSVAEGSAASPVAIPARAAAAPMLPMAAPTWTAPGRELAGPIPGGRRAPSLLTGGAATAAAPVPGSPFVATGAAAPAPAASLWGLTGGIAASAESFARDRGLASASADFPAGATLPTAPAASGRWLSVGGGMVFVPAPAAPSVQSTAAAAAAAAAAILARSAVVPSRPSAPSVLSTGAAAPLVAAPERAVPAAAVLGVGGIGLRSELFSAGVSVPPAGIESLAAWTSAPGLSQPLAQLLSERTAATGGRYALGPQGLIFVSGPQPERAQPALAPTGPAARIAAPAGSMPAASAALQASAPVPAVAERARPWLAPGGGASLAELFATGVVAGSGAASSLAERVGVLGSPSAGVRALGSPLLALLGAESAAATGSAAAATSRSAPALDWALPALAPPGTGSRAVQAVARSQRPQQPAQAPGLAAPSLRSLEPERTSAHLAAPPALYQQAGGLAASAEAFARDRGMAPASVAGVPGAEAAPSSRLVPLAGGLVMLRPEPTRREQAEAAVRPAQRPAQQPMPKPVAATEAQPLAAGLWPERAVSWQQAGGVGARSELFALTLGPSAPATGEAGAVLGGWAATPLLTSLPPERMRDEAPTLARYGWSGPGGLVFVPPTHRDEVTQAGAPSRSMAARPTLPALARAERLVAPTQRETLVAAEPTVARSAPALTMVAAAPRSGSESTVARAERGGEAAALQARYARGILTSFPTETPAARGEEVTALPTVLSPETTEQITRLSQLLGQLAQRSSGRLQTSLQAAWELGGVAGMPLWQRLQPELTHIATEIDSESEAGWDEVEHVASGPARGRPSLTMVQGTGRGAASQPSQAPAASPSSSRPRTPEAAISAAMAGVAQGGGAAAASVKLLQTLRAQASGQAGRSDDRVSLDDLTMVAISMGQNKIAASTNTGYSQAANTAEALLGHPNPPQVPDDEHAAKQKVEDMADRVVARLLNEDQLEGERFGIA
jgi:hypothetical protein